MCFFDFLRFRSALSNSASEGNGSSVEAMGLPPSTEAWQWFDLSEEEVEVVLEVALMIVCGLPSSKVLVITVRRGSGGCGGDATVV